MYLSKSQSVSLDASIRGAAKMNGLGDPAVGAQVGDMVNSANAGAVPYARLKLATNPTNNDTVTIGGVVVKFLTSLTTAGTFWQVKIGASAAATQLVVIDLFNGVTNANVVAGTVALPGYFLADSPASNIVRLRMLDGQGRMTPSSSTLTVANSLTAGADGWQTVNFGGGRSDTLLRTSRGKFTVTAGMVTIASVQVELPFVANDFCYDIYAAGVAVNRSDAVTLTASGDTSFLSLALAGGASPAVQANDVVVWEAWE